MMQCLPCGTPASHCPGGYGLLFRPSRSWTRAEPAGARHGLGLALVAKLVERHRGSVALEPARRGEPPYGDAAEGGLPAPAPTAKDETIAGTTAALIIETTPRLVRSWRTTSPSWALPACCTSAGSSPWRLRCASNRMSSSWISTCRGKRLTVLAACDHPQARDLR